MLDNGNIVKYYISVYVVKFCNTGAQSEALLRRKEGL